MGQQQSYRLADVQQRAAGVDLDAAGDYGIQGVRLGLPPANSTKDVVEANIDNMERQKLTETLASLGVPPAEDCSDDDLKAMLKVVVRSDFWRSAWNQHPGKGLVRMWVYAHDGFRKRLAAMRSEFAGEAELTQAAIGRVDAEFQAFVGKNAPHSDFEDNQLLPYFAENFKQFQQFWDELEEQHKRYEELEKAAGEQLKAAVSTGKSAAGDERQALAKTVVEFCDFYEAHMLLEERLLLPLWLGLGPEQRAQLRARMRGKYWLSSYSF